MRTIVRALAFAGMIPLLGACGKIAPEVSGSVALEPSHPAPVRRATCTAKRLLDGLTASPPLDYAAMRTEHAFAPFATEFEMQVLDETGAPCSGASSSRCGDAFAALPRVLPTDEAVCLAQYPARWGCSTSYLVYTRGDEVGRALRDDDILRLLATIDTPEEALWVLQHFREYSPRCNVAEEEFEGSVVATTDGFEFVFAACDGFRHTVTVTNDAGIIETAMEPRPVEDFRPCMPIPTASDRATR